MPHSPSIAELAPGAPFFILVNTGSGRDDGKDVSYMIRNAMELAGRRFELFVAKSPEDLDRLTPVAVEAAQSGQGAVVAAGGDGTLNTVAQAALHSGVPFGVLPQGTFNYFGRTHGIPEDTGEAIQVLLHGSPQPVQVGMVNERVFLVNGSIGLYQRLLQDREAFKQRFGRSRAAAIWSGIMTLLRERPRLVIRLEHGGKESLVRTPSLFVGNNRLQLTQVGIAEADAVERGELVAIIVKPVGTAALFGAALRGVLGKLGEAEQVQSFPFRRLTVQAAKSYFRPHLKVATDGEVATLATPLVFQVAPRPLMLIRPPGMTATA